MITSETPYLMTDILLDVVVKKIFPLLSFGWYLFAVLSHNAYVTKGSNAHTHSITVLLLLFLSG